MERLGQSETDRIDNSHNMNSAPSNLVSITRIRAKASRQNNPTDILVFRLVGPMRMQLWRDLDQSETDRIEYNHNMNSALSNLVSITRITAKAFRQNNPTEIIVFRLVGPMRMQLW